MKVFKHKIMKRDISETPDKWVIVKIDNNTNTPFYKVFATWSGGYLNGDRWKMNSGIKSIESDDDYYYFIGHSGSCYKCHKNGYGTDTSYGFVILNKIIEHCDGQIELMEDNGDWSNVV